MKSFANGPWDDHLKFWRNGDDAHIDCPTEHEMSVDTISANKRLTPELSDARSAAGELQL